ncbi:MAG: hypothetical protein R2774_04520 [Saprospiraceae bacterium]
MTSTGDIHWERTYINFDTYYSFVYPSSDNLVSDVIELSDETLYLGTLYQNIALRTDKNGCIDSNCKRFYELIP